MVGWSRSFDPEMKSENSLTGLQEPIPGHNTEAVSNIGHTVAPCCHKVD